MASQHTIETKDMNGKQAKKLRALAARLSPGGSGYVARRGMTLRGRPWFIVYCTGARATYHNLKRAFLSVSRPERNAWLSEVWKHA